MNFPCGNLQSLCVYFCGHFGYHRDFDSCLLEWQVILLGVVRKSSNWGLRDRDRREGRCLSQSKGVGWGTLGSNGS